VKLPRNTPALWGFPNTVTAAELRGFADELLSEGFTQEEVIRAYWVDDHETDRAGLVRAVMKAIGFDSDCRQVRAYLVERLQDESDSDAVEFTYRTSEAACDSPDFPDSADWRRVAGIYNELEVAAFTCGHPAHEEFRARLEKIGERAWMLGFLLGTEPGLECPNRDDQEFVPRPHWPLPGATDPD